MPASSTSSIPKMPLNCGPICLLSVAVLFALLGILVPVKIEEAIQRELSDTFLFVAPEGVGYDRWVSNEPPGSAEGFTYIWLYNITSNLTENQGSFTTEATPIEVERIGPYVFQNLYRNTNLTFKNEGGERVVEFTPYIYLKFLEEETLAESGRALTGDDNIIQPGIGMWTIIAEKAQLEAAGQWDTFRLFLALGGDETPPFETHTAFEWMFGFNDPTIELLKLLAADPETGEIPPLLAELPDEVRLLNNDTSPEEAAAEKGRTTLSLGFPNTARFQFITRFQDQENLDYWNVYTYDEEGNVTDTQLYEVDGAIGNFFGFRKKEEDVEEPLFWSLVYRTLRLIRVESGLDYKGLKVNRFGIDPAEWLNGTSNPNNAKFHHNWYDGVMNLSAPLTAAYYYSQWYLFQAEAFQNYTLGAGLPDLSDPDVTFIDIEPLTGAAVRGSRKIQGNMQFGGFVDIEEGFSGWNIPNLGLFPQYQADFRSSITDQQAEDLLEAIDFVEGASQAETAMIVLGFMGIPMLLLAVYCVWKNKQQYQQRYGIMEDEFESRQGGRGTIVLTDRNPTGYGTDDVAIVHE